MKPRTEQEEEEREREEDWAPLQVPERAPDRPRTAYRVAGDLEVRAAELRQEIGEQRATIERLEHEVSAARRAVRNRRRLTVLSNGGLGALVGVLLGNAAAFYFATPVLVLAATIVGFIVGLRWMLPDDDDNLPKT